MINAVPPRYETTDMPRPENTAMVPHAVITDETPKCWRCRRTLAGRMSRPWQITCQRCNAQNASLPENR